MASALGETPLSDEILGSSGSRLLDRSKLPGDTAGDLDASNLARQAVKTLWVDGDGGILRDSAPLWYHVLRRAEYHGVMHRPEDPAIGFGGQHLGPVGSRILCETLLGLLWMDRSSFLHSQRGFVPAPQITAGARLTLPVLMHNALG